MPDMISQIPTLPGRTIIGDTSSDFRMPVNDQVNSAVCSVMLFIARCIASSAASC